MCSFVFFSHSLKFFISAVGMPRSQAKLSPGTLPLQSRGVNNICCVFPTLAEIPVRAGGHCALEFSSCICVCLCASVCEGVT